MLDVAVGIEGGALPVRARTLLRALPQHTLATAPPLWGLLLGLLLGLDLGALGPWALAGRCGRGTGADTGRRGESKARPAGPLRLRMLSVST